MIEFIIVAIIAIGVTAWFQHKHTCVYGNHNFIGKTCSKCGLTKVTVKK